MAKPEDEPRYADTGLDRRAVIRTALVVGGASALGGGAAMARENPGAFAAEREWARALARQVADQLPEAARLTPELNLTPDQLERLRTAFENTLVTNMGCVNPSK
jgi:hypothetical protein